MDAPTTFRAVLQLDGATATGIAVPDDVVAALGPGRRHRVVVTLPGHTFRTTLGTVDGVVKVPVSADVRRAAGVAAGEELEVALALDTEPRTVALPEDLDAALTDDARRFWRGLSPSRQRAWAEWVTSAKKEQTRRTRVVAAAQALADGRAQR